MSSVTREETHRGVDRARRRPHVGAQRTPAAVVRRDQSVGERADDEIEELHGVSLGDREEKESLLVEIGGDLNL